MNRHFDSALNDYLDAYVQEKGNTGMLRITLKDEVIFEKNMGYADREEKRPFTRESMFTLYSLSKPFSAIGLMKLKEQGKVDIDCHPGKYVKEARGFHPAVTMRQILQHIGGLPDFVQSAGFPERYQTGHPHEMRRHMEELAAFPPMFAPGTGSRYANVNFILCALMIENISGMPYEEYMQKEVFAPLSMPHARVDAPGLFVPNRVTGYEKKADEIRPVSALCNWMMGAGDIVGTVDDIYCLNKAIKHHLLLKEETWKEILTPSPVNQFGLGCSVFTWHGMERIQHNGGSQGFRTLHIQLPADDLDIIYLSNASWGDARNDFAEAIYRAIYEKNAPEGEKIQMDAGYI